MAVATLASQKRAVWGAIVGVDTFVEGQGGTAWRSLWVVVTLLLHVDGVDAEVVVPLSRSP